MIARQFNDVRLSGVFVRDPELKYDANQIPVMLFTLVNEYTIGYGETQKTIKSYLDCFARSGVAQYIAETYRKGDEIIVTGRLQERNWNNATGPRTGVEVVVRYTRRLADGK